MPVRVYRHGPAQIDRGLRCPESWLCFEDSGCFVIHQSGSRERTAAIAFHEAESHLRIQTYVRTDLLAWWSVKAEICLF